MQRRANTNVPRQDDTAQIVQAVAQGQVEGIGLSDLAIRFDVVTYPSFVAEVAYVGNDVVYHFWPPDGTRLFRPGFGKCLEVGFKQICGQDWDVRAEWFPLDEEITRHLMASWQGDGQGEGSGPRENYYVRILDRADSPMADAFFKGKVFRKIQEAMELSL